MLTIRMADLLWGCAFNNVPVGEVRVIWASS